MSKPASNEVDNEAWKDSWQQGSIGFHIGEVHPGLTQNWERAVSELGPGKGTELTVLVPLCGGSRDLPWLCRRPEVRRVVGVELSRLALDLLLKENPDVGELSRRVVADSVECHESADGRLRFYVADFFSDAVLREVGGQCDVVWDRGALVAIDVCDRRRYCDRVRDFANPAGHVVLLEAVVYDKSEYKGPPHAFDESDLQELFDDAAYSRRQRLASKAEATAAQEFGVRDFRIDIWCIVAAGGSSRT